MVLCLLTINAINFIDGLDGLAAGVSAIAALAFFAYSYHLAREGYGDVAFAPVAAHRRAGRGLPRLPAAQLLAGPDLHG